ncbi:MAG: mannose-1-phosphate guanylyltransferase/mannose-6-phosphate isomerase [Gammaproteobacteria bacterium RIFCSPHIGHO2_12_FULL_38_14]|nr:MAG: mannose-1-phosphate guanylyltransferase/mannose-6-phosphate isomerase [Gammaproteobacteria bacterium RIFCSPHIGHO2_12_FULL_38_14]
MINIKEYSEKHQIKFGTSGIRAANEQLTDEACYLYTIAFLQYLEHTKQINNKIIIAGDLRSNTDHLIKVIYQAITGRGYSVEYGGKIPTPALCYYAMHEKAPAIMVTGSHISPDMNGFKYYKPDGEILKSDENEILSENILLDLTLFDHHQLKLLPDSIPITDAPYQFYITRYLKFFPKNALKGMHIGVYSHSSVAIKALIEIIKKLGAIIKVFGNEKNFHALDTEALSTQDKNISNEYAKLYQLDAIVSTDGDGDRPLISDENGNWIQGDIIGILCTLILKADHVVVPLSCNRSIDVLPTLKKIVRTKIGSPYVIEKMLDLIKDGETNVLGFESNGGVLVGSEFIFDERNLEPLPTRDAILPILLILSYLNKNQLKIHDFIQNNIFSYTVSDSLKFILPYHTESFFSFLTQNNTIAENIKLFFKQDEPIEKIELLDGMAIYFENGEMIYLRQSGNSPELRCYTESNTEAKAKKLNNRCMILIKQWMDNMTKPHEQIIPVLLSGGVGKRLWPLSRSSYPKQFLRLYNDKTLIQNTILRCQNSLSLTQAIITGNEKDKFIISSQLTEINIAAKAIILEPASHNTGPAIAIASFFTMKNLGDQLILVMPVDHKIDDIESFWHCVDRAKQYALEDYIVVFGTKPNSPDPGYGYIEVNHAIHDQAYLVKKFIEKPEKSLAIQFVSDGMHYWNAGIYLFKASRILNDFEKFQPEIFAYCKKAYAESIEENSFVHLPPDIYQQCPSISIDYAIIEKAANICMIPLTSDWKDIGNWQSLYDIAEKDENQNVIEGNIVAIDTVNSYLRTEDKLIATVGLQNCFVVESHDALLIVNRDYLQKMIELTDILGKHHQAEMNALSVMYRAWGYCHVIESSPHYRINKVVMFPNQNISFENEKNHAAHWLVLKGEATIILENNKHVLHANESIFIAAHEVYQLENKGLDNLELIQIEIGLALDQNGLKNSEEIFEL